MRQSRWHRASGGTLACSERRTTGCKTRSRQLQSKHSLSKVGLTWTQSETELAPGQRIVQDWFRDCGSMVWARERITTDKADQGRRCPRGGYLLDGLDAFHETCPWRERTGLCQMCQGTPVADRDAKKGSSDNIIRLKELTSPYWASKPQESDLRIELAQGSTIALRGADSYDSLRGQGLDLVVLDEFASMAPAAWKEVLRPALADRQGGALFIGTPRSYNHSYDLYEGAQG